MGLLKDRRVPVAGVEGARARGARGEAREVVVGEVRLGRWWGRR